MDCLAVFSPEQVESLFEWGGYFILFGLLFACGLGLPMPEDIPLLAAGFFIAHGKMDPIIAGAVAWCGIIGGDLMLYHIAKRVGLEITRVPFVGKHVTKERILKAEELFNEWGVWVVGFGRLFAGIRGAMVIAAGAIRYNLFKFIIVDGIAALFSGALFVLLGYWAGKKLGTISEMRQKIKGVEHWLIIAGILVLLMIVLYFIWRRRKHVTLSDVALKKAVEKAHHHQERHQEAS